MVRKRSKVIFEHAPLTGIRVRAIIASITIKAVQWHRVPSGATNPLFNWVQMSASRSGGGAAAAPDIKKGCGLLGIFD
jgi:hypothetical protein